MMMMPTRDRGRWFMKEKHPQVVMGEENVSTLSLSYAMYIGER